MAIHKKQTESRSRPQIRVAKLPPPKPLTKEQMEQAFEEGKRWSKDVIEGTKTLESLTSEDLSIRVKSNKMTELRAVCDIGSNSAI